jgi:hypothetical protein
MPVDRLTRREKIVATLQGLGIAAGILMFLVAVWNLSWWFATEVWK